VQRLIPWVLVAAAVLFVRAPFLIDAAPHESTMGLVQKIFYFHVPAAMLTLVSAMVCGVASGAYLWRRRPMADHVALAAAELVIVFGIITLITGPLWARKAWGVWWQWEARLTITLVMWMVFVAYSLLRRFGGPGSDVMAAAVGIFGMALGPFAFWSVNVWRTLHPTTEVVWTLPPEMAGPFVWCIVAFAALYVTLLMVRARVAAAEHALDAALLELEE
jgi:heme exporter protein C